MAKQPPASKNGTARIRFVMLEAEFPEGDMSQITQAIQNALKPASITIQRLPSMKSQQTISGPPSAEIAEDDLDVEEETEPSEDKPESKVSARPLKPRSYPIPEVVEIDAKSPTSLEDFASTKSPDSDAERFLVIAAWFKECRNQDDVGPDEVFTCYKLLKWPSGLEEFARPLRGLKAKKLMKSTSKGRYAINQVGLQRVSEMTKA